MKLLLQAMAFGILLIAVILTFGSFGVFHPVPWFLFAALIGIPVINNKMEERRYIIWKPKYNTGIKDVDAEHMALMNLINRLQLAVRYHQGECFEQEALEELVEYTATHFKREEKLMLAHDYPAYEFHKELHDEMTRDVMMHVARFKEEGHTALVDLAPIISGWLANHICVEDQAFAKFLLEKEQSEETEHQEVIA